MWLKRQKPFTRTQASTNPQPILIQARIGVVSLQRREEPRSLRLRNMGRSTPRYARSRLHGYMVPRGEMLSSSPTSLPNGRGPVQKTTPNLMSRSLRTSISFEAGSVGIRTQRSTLKDRVVGIGGQSPVLSDAVESH